MNDYEKGYKDGMAGAALPNIIDNGDKIDGYTYMYKTDSDGIPFINIESVRSMLNKAAEGKHGKFVPFTDIERYETFKDGGIPYDGRCSECDSCLFNTDKYCGDCGARMDLKDGDAK